MYQFKSNQSLKQTLKFGKPKSPNSHFAQKPSTAQSKNSSMTSFTKPSDIQKAPTSYWKKGTTSTFPVRPETTYIRYSSQNPSCLTESMPLSELRIDSNIQLGNIQTSRQSENLNLSDTCSGSILESRQVERSSFVQPLISSSVTDRSGRVQGQQVEINNLQRKLSEALRKKEQFERKFEETSEQLARMKETNRQQSKKMTETTNLNNQLQADLFIVSSKLKQKQESISSVSQENDLKILIVELSQQKSELINKVSELEEEKARKDNSETFNKIEKLKIDNELESTRIQQLQEIQSLKSRINELEQQHNPNQKEYYEDRIRMLEKEVKGLLLKCVAINGQERLPLFGDRINDLGQLRLMVENQNQKHQMHINESISLERENYGLY